jgi:hypothetical protein
MAKKALCVGVNNYPGTRNDLQGCVNDARDWARLLSGTFGFRDVETLLDGQATRSRIKKKLGELISKGRAGDVLVFTYSGHGTHVPDVGEKDEADGRDEAICARTARSSFPSVSANMSTSLSKRSTRSVYP